MTDFLNDNELMDRIYERAKSRVLDWDYLYPENLNGIVLDGNKIHFDNTKMGDLSTKHSYEENMKTHEPAVIWQVQEKISDSVIKP